MELDIMFTAAEVDGVSAQGKNAVVIDVLRATTTMITSLVNGCEFIMPVVEPEDGQKLLAQALARGEKRSNYYLCGEREGVLIPGFDLGNSPLEYAQEVVRARKLIFSTTNGTLAINNAKVAKRLLLGALVNGRAVAKALREYNEPILIVCAGTKGVFTLEDVLAGGLIIHELLGYGVHPQLSDRAVAALALYRHHQEDILQVMNLSRHANVLISLGYAEDVKYCAKINIFDHVPYFKDGKISIF
jgi:2-phosphosulfolactate phosphatase